MQVEAIDNGADLSTMSTWEFQGGNDGSDQWDYTIVPTLSSFFSSLFQKSCNGPNVTLNLGEKVVKVDYSGTNIVVNTDKGQY